MADVSAMLKTAVQHHQAGRFEQAELMYRQVLQEQPDNPAALHSLGTLAYQKSQYDMAIDLVGKAIASNPQIPQFHNTYGVILEAVGNAEEAIDAYRQAVRLKSDYAEAYNNMAIALQSQGQYASAVEKCSKATSLDPDYAAAYNTMGFALQMQGKFTEAIENYRKAAQLKPDFAEAYNHLGVVLSKQERHDEAIENYRQALRINPDYAEVHNNLSIALKDKGRFDEAVDNYKRAISLKSDYAEAYNNLGIVLKNQGKFAEAVTHYKHALRLEPQFPEAYYNLGNALKDQGRCDEATEKYKRAIQIKPDYAQAHWNQSHAFLLKGDLIKGWEGYQWRRNDDLEIITYPHQHQKPRWDGSAFVGKRLFVHCEQGLGDSLQFIRYLPMVKARGGTVIFEAWKSLHGILQGFEGIDELLELSFETKSDVEFDLCVSLMDLPGIFGTTLETIPAKVPYVYADSDKVTSWRDRLADANFKVGIVWASSPRHGNDHNRSCSLELFAPLTAIEGARLYGLQKGQAADQAKRLSQVITVENFSEDLEDFTDTAGLIENLDLVISVDTAAAHLAGAMGKEVWILLPFAPDWRWMLERTDSPWYPTMRLFRQKN